MPAQRIRLWFNKGERVRHISHLDVLRYWERVVRRAGLPLSYSSGFTPHPKLAFAGPLPLGFAAEGEIVDITLDERVPIDEVRSAISAQTSPDIRFLDLREIAVSAPPPQSTLAWADYRFDLPGTSSEEAGQAIEGFLARETFEWVDERREKTRTYDMRAGVASLRVEPLHEGVRVFARLRAGQEFTLRPEELLKAILPGHTATLYTRQGLILDEPSTAREAWRKQGQFAE